jgi:hypothetical protein
MADGDDVVQGSIHRSCQSVCQDGFIPSRALLIISKTLLHVNTLIPDPR